MTSPDPVPVPVLAERSGAVAIVTINRPDRHNALTGEVKNALRDALDDLGADPSVRALVLTGAGRSFCVGQDLAEHARALRSDPESAFATVEEHYNPIVLALMTMPKPVVAAVNGTCAGAGVGLALACDLRVMASTARWSAAFTGIGLSCDTGLSASLARSVGESRARELVLLGRPFTSAEAVRWGIAGDVVEADRVVPDATKLARELAAGPTTAYAEAKRALADAWSRPLPEVLAAEAAAQRRAGATDDHAGAVEAFLAKRSPEFTGH
ncbi:2-(1,2-epoxy-1,2-dihydrophenyl)acetyl-CoA isomerase [Actinomadura pelletieri DSM 43383]|uniref:2-(1,2-epoxy-1,2-dihydrophenyl)acetyl-CoA isomerase n=1 Tax=Actinomadura pelletieri DSM 43383 TaxID=1120940 RepID=A0A495QKM8_9ACTN|nr:enoyl-CoA hydratase-related protein [Actinomadura pelletieri]RKS73147.1 2-(1,2-epoxy-1,2-dihydrophenyl)acetyl-CoA isomerase [Actinomadura pelletieri DSM 43383]